jgi:hypothetical protein
MFVLFYTANIQSIFLKTKLTGRKITKIFDTLPLDAQSDIAEALGRKVY